MGAVKTILVSMLCNPAVQAVIIGGLVVGCGWVVKKTKTEKDDKVYAMAVHAFDIAEKIIPDGTINPPWVGKLDNALKIFREQYVKRNGKDPSEEAISLAKDIFAIMAHNAKA
jgi:hypothetical protein